MATAKAASGVSMNSSLNYFAWRTGPDWLRPAVQEVAADFMLMCDESGGRPHYWFDLAVEQNGRGASLVSFSVCTACGGRWLEQREADGASLLPAEIKRLARLTAFMALQAALPDRPRPPWGILHGIRPGKLATRLLSAGLAATETQHRLADAYGVSADRATLITDIALRQQPYLAALAAPRQVGVYVSVPFCPTRCLYCSFPSAVRPSAPLIRSFLQAVGHDIAAVIQLLTRFNLVVKTLYVGGGTPTVLADDEFQWLLTQLAPLAAQAAEFTVEAGRPDTYSPQKLTAMAAHGVTRISLNPQTMQDATLQQIGRCHTASEVRTQMRAIRACGIPVVNMDVIAGLPGETAHDFDDSISQVLDLAPENLTVHTLALKRRSPLFAAGQAALAAPETVAQMVATAASQAARYGLQPYYLYRQRYISGNLENIGYAKPQFESRYNIQMMEEWQTVVGVGPAAVTKLVQVPGRKVAHFFMPKDAAYYAASLERLTSEREDLLASHYSAKEDMTNVDNGSARNA